MATTNIVPSSSTTPTDPNTPTDASESRAVDCTSPIDSSKELRAELDKLLVHGVPCETWSGADVNNGSFLVSQFIKSIRIITSIADEALREAILYLGALQGFFPSESESESWMRGVTPTTLYYFSQWLRTPGGTREISQTQHDMKMRRKAASMGATAEAIASLAAFNRQVFDWNEHKKEVRADAVKRIAQLQLEIRKIQDECDDAVGAMPEDYVPACMYREIKGRELSDACHEMYLADCRALDVLPQSSVLPVQCVERYGKAVREQHVLSFIQAPAHKEQLETYLYHKIWELVSKDDFKEAESLRRILRSMGGKVADVSKVSI